MPQSISYRPSLIARLKNIEYAAGFLTAILEEQNPEPELLPSALADAIEALGAECMSLEETRLWQEKVSKWQLNMTNSVSELGDLLKVLGLKLTVTVSESQHIDDCEGKTVQVSKISS